MSAHLKKVLDFIESSGEPLPGCGSEEEGLALAEKLAPDVGAGDSDTLFQWF